MAKYSKKTNRQSESLRDLDEDIRDSRKGRRKKTTKKRKTAKRKTASKKSSSSWF